MRVAIVRSDIGHFLLDDVENSSQRCFSSQTVGQSRYFSKPTDAQLTALLVGAGVAASNLGALKAAAYPTATTVDVSSATLSAVSGITALGSGPKAILVAKIADLIAPSLVETGPVLLSFVKGKLSKLRVSSFQPGGARSGIPAGIAAAILTDAGGAAFTLLVPAFSLALLFDPSTASSMEGSKSVLFSVKRLTSRVLPE